MNNKSKAYAIGAFIFFVLLVPVVSSNASTYQGSMTGWVQPSYVAKPARIIIPTAKVNAQVVDIGVTKTNHLDVPPNYYQAGWYKYGPTPGMPGNAVIDGHVDNGGKIPGPFKHLRKAKVGDEIMIRMNDGTDILYVITDASVSSYKQFPKESVFRGDGKTSVLKIITCHGKFLPSEDTYDQRLIVTAVKKQASSVATR